MTNCKNCGAVIDLSALKCPYCDTPYPIDILIGHRDRYIELRESVMVEQQMLSSIELYKEAINAMRVISYRGVNKT